MIYWSPKGLPYDNSSTYFFSSSTPFLAPNHMYDIKGIKICTFLHIYLIFDGCSRSPLSMLFASDSLNLVKIFRLDDLRDNIMWDPCNQICGEPNMDINSFDSQFKLYFIKLFFSVASGTHIIKLTQKNLHLTLMLYLK